MNDSGILPVIPGFVADSSTTSVLTKNYDIVHAIDGRPLTALILLDFNKVFVT